MPERLQPEELALARKAARSERISTIRRRVAVTGALLASVFSGLILVRSEVNQPAEAAPESAPVTASLDTGSGGEASEQASITDTIVSAASTYALNTVFGDEGESDADSDEGSDSAPSLSTSQS